MEARKLEQRGRRRLMARNVSEVGSVLSLAHSPRAPPAPAPGLDPLACITITNCPAPPRPRAPATPCPAVSSLRATCRPREQLQLGNRHLNTWLAESLCSSYKSLHYEKCLTVKAKLVSGKTATVTTVHTQQLVHGPKRCVTVKLLARMWFAGGTRITRLAGGRARVALMHSLSLCCLFKKNDKVVGFPSPSHRSHRGVVRLFALCRHNPAPER